MLPGMILVIASIIGIINGIKKNNKTMIIISVLVLIAVIIFVIGYSYLYAQNPY